MSEYSELQQYVASLAANAQQSAEGIVAYSRRIEKSAALFDRLTATTNDRSAAEVGANFRDAQKQLLLAARALLEAAKAGGEWCGDSGPVKKLVLKPSGR